MRLSLAEFRAMNFPLRLSALDLQTRPVPDLGPGLLRAVDYGSFAWLELDETAFQKLLASRLPFQEESEYGLISFDRFRFDPLKDGEPRSIAPQLAGAPLTPAGKGLYLVQLRAPASETDLLIIQASGVLLQHVPYNAFLLWSDAAGLQRLSRRMTNLRWSGDFHSAYRISSRLEVERLAAAAGDSLRVQFLVLDDGSLPAVERAIRDWGGAILDRSPRHVPGEAMKMAVWELTLPASQVDDLARLPQVIAIDRYSESYLDDERSDQIIADNAPGGDPDTGYRAWLTATGYDGDGVKVAIVDTGTDWDHSDLNVASGTEYGGYSETGEPGSDGASGTGHGTHVSGIVAGDGYSGSADSDGFVYGLGVAPGATLHAMDAISGDHSSVSLYRRVYDAASNADLSNNSWYLGNTGVGYTLDAANQDDYILDAIDDNGSTLDPFLTVFSAGNAGDDCAVGPCMTSITDPKEAKNLLVVGGSDSRRSNWTGGLTGDIDDISSYSSRGPAVDGRILPHLVAPGDNIISAEDTSGSVDPCETMPTGSTAHVYCSGTSMASPHAAGAAALFTQFWRLRNFTSINPWPATVIAALVNATDDLGGAGDDGWGHALGHRPDGHQGWGRLNIDRLLNPAVAVQYYQNPSLLTAAGQSWQIQVTVNDTSQPLRITLAWSDAPGASGANPARVNDLDLRVTAPNATVWYGNRFGTDGWSATGVVDDDLHNLENVWIQFPAAGTYTLRVEAEFINGDAYYYNGDSSDQHFSLVCYNCEKVLGGAYDAGADEANAFVSLNGSLCEFGSVSAAITAASPGDTLYISPGVYHETLGTISKNLSLVAADTTCRTRASSGVTIDADDLNRVAEIGAGVTVTLTNLILVDGTNALGGILYGSSGSKVVLDDTDLAVGSASSFGGGLRLYNATAELRNGSVIRDNLTTGAGQGGGVALTSGSTLILTHDSRIGGFLDGNQSASSGGGVYMAGGLLEMYDDSAITGNGASSNGGGVYAATGAEVNLYNHASIGSSYLYQENSAYDGGGVYLTGNGTTLYLRSASQVQGNQASHHGGGIYATGQASVLLNNARVSENGAAYDGGGIYLSSSATLNMLSSKLNENTAGDNGGGLFATGGAQLLISTDFIHSTALAAAPARSGLHAASCNPFSLPADTYCSEVRGNTAGDNGGGIFMDGNSNGIFESTVLLSNTAAQGAALDLTDGLAWLHSVLLASNTTTGLSGAAAHVLDSGGPGATDLYVYQSTFTGNSYYAVKYEASTAGEFENNIVWGNGHKGLYTLLVSVSCNDTQGGALSGSGNISQDPLFTTTSRGSYRLRYGSPAVDACSTGETPDLDGRSRPQSTAYDMGAFELELIIFKVYLPLVRK